MQPTERGPLELMALIYLSIPLMMAAVAIAVVPLGWAMKNQARWEEAPVVLRPKDPTASVAYRRATPGWTPREPEMAFAASQ